jgi:sulfatase modifying factor 1
MKYTALLAALAALLIANQSANAQGALTPPGAPAESQKSLQEIYDAIQSAKSEFATLVQQAVPSVPGMVTVLGGKLPESSQLSGQKVATFYIGQNEVTWNEWQEVRDWAVNNGYNDLGGVGDGSAGNHPVRNVSWHDALKWCNAFSEKDGLEPVYKVGGEPYRNGIEIPIVNKNAAGYRLPRESEWEWAARGGVLSKGFLYSGSDDIGDVGLCWDNSDGAEVDLYITKGTWPVASKAPNELGIYDMSGNVWEWCEELIGGTDGRIRGGTWIGAAIYCHVEYRLPHGNDPSNRDYGIGFRLARNY